jgi:hypothetical protein
MQISASVGESDWNKLWIAYVYVRLGIEIGRDYWSNSKRNLCRFGNDRFSESEVGSWAARLAKV